MIGSSGTIGICSVTRSPFFRPQKSRNSAAISFTRLQFLIGDVLDGFVLRLGDEVDRCLLFLCLAR